MSTPYAYILLIEDDNIDAEIVVRAFKRLKIQNPIVRVVDGVDALAKLRGSRDVQPLPAPYLILLDLNLPRMNGLEFLQIIRQDEKLKRSVVIVLTVSSRDEDKIAAASYQVIDYIEKRSDGFGFLEIIQSLNRLQ